jgi:hypothetical protein
MMEYRLVKGIKPLKNYCYLIQYLKDKFEESQETGKEVALGIENEAGEIFLIIFVEGTTDYLGVQNVLMSRFIKRDTGGVASTGERIDEIYFPDPADKK